MNRAHIVRLPGRSPSSILLALVVVLGVALGDVTTVAARARSGRGAAGNPVQIFDANIRYTSGIFVPLRTYTAASVQPLTTQAWTNAGRPVTRVVADGATLLLIRAELPVSSQTVTFSLRSPQSLDVGSLLPIDVDDPRVVDVSSQGGEIY